MIKNARIKNFLFHRVNPVRDALWDPMDVPRFDRCIRYLSKKYTVLSLEEACDAAQRYTAKPIATISFDDGYHDNLEYAAPILQRHQCTASFYIVTDCIDKGCMIWTQAIKHYFQNTNMLEFSAPRDYLPSALRICTWPGRKERLDYARTIRNFLLKADQSLREIFLKDMQESFTDVAVPELMMTWADVQQLHAAGFVIGSHTATHPALTSLTDAEEVTRELSTSGRRIEEMLGFFPLSIAYPFGAHSRREMLAAEGCGYKYGVTTLPTPHNPVDKDAYAISRISLENEPWLKTLARIQGAYERMKEVIKSRENFWDSLALPLCLIGAGKLLEALPA